MPSKPVLAFTCGGTGGHVYPAIALAQELSEYAVQFVGTTDREDHRIVTDYGFPFTAVGSRALTIMTIWPTAYRVWRFLVTHRPALLISTGGGQTAMVVVCAKWLGIRIVLLEQNAIPGRTNRLLSALAHTIITAFPPRSGDFPNRLVRVLGNPIRKQYKPDSWFDDFKAHLPTDLPMVLIFGGSQGAKRLNSASKQLYAQFLDAGFVVVHIVGKANLTTLWEASFDNRVFQLGYCDAMDWLYHHATYVICRAGATSIAELIAFQKPAILVPYPFAKDDHQRANARYFCAHYPGTILEESDISWARIRADFDQLDSHTFPAEAATARAVIADYLREIIPCPPPR